MWWCPKTDKYQVWWSEGLFAGVNADWHAADKARGADITTQIQCIVMTYKNTLFILLWALVTERPIVTTE